MMRFITVGPGSGKRDRRDHFSVVRRAFIKIYDCQKVRIDPCLIASPDKENFFRFIFLFLFVFLFPAPNRFLFTARSGAMSRYEAERQTQTKKETGTQS